MRQILYICTMLVSCSLFAQVGINTTTPDPSAMLDIEASDKGLLIPRVSLGDISDTMLDGTNTAATGLLVYNTNASITGGDGIGYYSFNGATWDKIITSASGSIGGDADFYEVGTTNAPDDITDNMFTQGNVAIGKNTADYPLDVVGSGTRGVSVLMDGADNNSKVGSRNEISNTGNALHYGVLNTMSGTGSGTKTGMYNLFSSSANGPLQGIDNRLIITSNSNSSKIGINNNISSNGNGFHFGIDNTLVSSGTGRQTGIDTGIGGIGTGDFYGSRISITGNGATKYGSYIDIDETSAGSHFGLYSMVLKANSYAGYFLGRVAIGTTTANTYILPLSRGTNQQIMQTDSSGNVSWVDPGSVANGDADFYEIGTTTPPDDINDDIYHLGKLSIGAQLSGASKMFVSNSDANSGSSLSVIRQGTFGAYAQLITATVGPSGGGISNNVSGSPTGTDLIYGIRTTVSPAAGATGAAVGYENSYASNENVEFTGFRNSLGGNTSVPIGGLSNRFIGSGSGSKTGVSNLFSASITSQVTGVYNQFDAAGSTLSRGMHNVFVANATTQQYGLHTIFNNTANNLQYGVYNQLNGSGGSTKAGVRNELSNNGSGQYYGSFTTLSGTGAGSKYGSYNRIETTTGGNLYGVYSEVLRGTGIAYAGYFLGNVSIGTTAVNTYTLPSSRGLNGQVMQTNSSGIVSWATLPAGSDDWTTSGNAGTNPTNDFIGTTDFRDFVVRTNNTESLRVKAKGNLEIDATPSVSGKHIFIGENTGLNFNSASDNLLIGNFAGDVMTSGSFNVALGTNNLGLFTGGDRNTAIGTSALQDLTMGNRNNALGNFAGINIDRGDDNIFIGEQTGNSNSGATVNASQNVLIGSYAGETGTGIIGDNNVMIGYYAGRVIGGTPTGNVLIGNRAGSAATDLDNRLFIENSNSNSPLVYGEFDNNLVRVNGDFYVNDTSIITQQGLLQNDDNFVHGSDANLDFGAGGNHIMMSSQEGGTETGGIHLDGNSVTIWSPADNNRALRVLDEDDWGDNDGNPFNNTAELAYIDNNGQYIQASDRGRKENVKRMVGSLDKITQLNGYTYQYKVNAVERSKGEKPLKTSGVIAQELQKVLPEAVQVSEEGEYFVHYAGITPLLIEGIKELQLENDRLKENQKELEQRVERLEKLLLKD